MEKSDSELPPLSDAQREIMEIVWDHEEVSVRDVREIIARDREVARNTVRTLLERMEEKGWLIHRADGRTYRYSAAQPRTATVGQKVVEVLDQVCGGSPEALMTALLDYRGLTSQELVRVRTMLESAKGKDQAERSKTKKKSKNRGR